MAISPIPNPFNPFADDDLTATWLSLTLACGRAKGVFKDKHRTRLCGMLVLLDDELARRGKPQPPRPYRA